MFYNYNNRKYTKLDTYITKQVEKDENIPANFQNEPNVQENEKMLEMVEGNQEFVSLLESSDTLTTSYSSGTRSSDSNTNEAEMKSEHSANDSNDFCDAECGEPAVSQRLTIDFTLSNDDTEFSQKKCCDFWDFIYAMSHLKNLMVIPEPEYIQTKQTDSVQDETSSANVSRTSHSTDPYTTAVGILLKKKIAEGPVPSSFVAKDPSICRNKNYLSYCHGSCDKMDREMREKLKEPNEKTEKPAIEVQPTRKSFLSKLCSQMDAWDLKHPKCFDPPQPAPVLSPPPKCETTQYPSSVTSQKDTFCLSDTTCVTCPHKPLEVDLVKKED